MAHTTVILGETNSVAVATVASQMTIVTFDPDRPGAQHCKVASLTAEQLDKLIETLKAARVAAFGEGGGE